MFSKKTLFNILKVAIMLGTGRMADRACRLAPGAGPALHLSWPFLGLYILFQLLGNLLSVYKWRIIARSKKLDFTLKDGFFLRI
ncbi:MAG: hypothetical protein WDN67_05245 [Candidatus Moraniibacteriota bacterium]